MMCTQQNILHKTSTRSCAVCVARLAKDFPKTCQDCKSMATKIMHKCPGLAQNLAQDAKIIICSNQDHRQDF